MKARAIVKIVVCSVLAVIFLTVFAAAMLISSEDFFREELSLELPEVFSGDQDFLPGGAEITQPVRDLEIDWASGQVIVRAYEGEGLRFSEGLSSKMGSYTPDTQDIPPEYAPDSDSALGYQVVNGTLTIRAEQDTWSFLDINRSPSKVLLVLVPQGELNRIEINNASALVKLEGLTVESAELDTASGDILLENCKVTALSVDSASGDCEVTGEVKHFEIDTASGDAKLKGSVEEVEMETASGDLLLTCENTPREISFSSASGYGDITLPENSEFTAELDTASGDLSVSDFTVRMEDGVCIVGSGEADYEFDTASGDVTIRSGG